MKKLLYIAIVLALAACRVSGSGHEALDEARRLMHSDPSAALSRLNALDVSELPDSATMAQWALLYSEALAANRVYAPNDTIVDIAIDYYGRHRRSDEFRKASALKALNSSAGDRDELATALYLQKEKEFFLYRERATRRMLVLGFIVALIAAVAVIAWMRQRLRAQSLQNEALMAEASGLKCLVEAGRGDVGRLESKLWAQLESRFSLIDSLCQTYYESQGTKTERKAIVDKVKHEIESVRSDSFPRMERTVNDCRDNLLEKLRVAYPEIKPEEYQLLVYLAGGLSSRTISLLLGESVDVVYKRKSRLKARLRERLGADEATLAVVSAL